MGQKKKWTDQMRGHCRGLGEKDLSMTVTAVDVGKLGGFKSCVFEEKK